MQSMAPDYFIVATYTYSHNTQLVCISHILIFPFLYCFMCKKMCTYCTYLA